MPIASGGQRLRGAGGGSGHGAEHAWREHGRRAASIQAEIWARFPCALPLCLEHEDKPLS